MAGLVDVLIDEEFAYALEARSSKWGNLSFRA